MIVFIMAIEDINMINISESNDTIVTDYDDDIGKRITPFLEKGTVGTCIKFNQSDPFHIGDRYGGIPLNLLTNTIGWAILLVII